MSNETENNYTGCFVAILLMLVAFLVITFLIFADLTKQYDTMLERNVSRATRDAVIDKHRAIDDAFNIKQEAVNMGLAFWTINEQNEPWFLWNSEAVAMGWGFMDENNVYHMNGENQ